METKLEAKRNMESKLETTRNVVQYPYGVLVKLIKNEGKENESCHVVPLAHSFSIDDACGLALGYFRNSNVPGLKVVVYRRNNNEEVVVFSHERI